MSTIFWMLMVVVTLEYACLVLRADNRREGGILAYSRLRRGRFARTRNDSAGCSVARSSMVKQVCGLWFLSATPR